MLKASIALISIVSVLNAQENKEVPDIESVYLHTDRVNYTLGESLWYKAYLVYPYKNLLYSKSNILYVELISPESKIIARNKTRIENGLGHGDFKLTDSIGVKKPGTYQIRAYTNWNRNFSENFVFKKNIEVFAVFDAAVDQGAQATKQKKKTNLGIEPPKKAYDIQFFPEGGSLLEGVNNIIAFKAVDDNGLPISLKGNVYTASDSLVTLFGTMHDGMGKFQLHPKKGHRYYAKVFTDNEANAITVPLPQAMQQGYVLSYRKVNGKHMLLVKTNANTLQQAQNQQVKITFKFKGLTYFEISQAVNKPVVSFELPQNKLPEGINQITLYDALSRPHSERLIYNEINHNFEISLSTNKKVYKPNEKVTVLVSSKTQTGQGVPASYSLSSIDLNGAKNTNLHTNICSHFLLESDIKGKVHHPGYYFNPDNPRRLDNLDLLLLTQGWRDFLWKKLPERLDYRAPFLAEQGIDLSGRLKQKFGSKPKPNNNITLTLFNKNKINMINTETDSLGRFRFPDLMFFGKAKIILSSSNDKGKGRGMLILDAISRPPLDVDFKPSINVTDTVQAQVVKESILRKYVNFGVMPENVLDEVEIVAKIKKDEPASIYGTPDHRIVFDNETRVYSTIYQLIQSNVPGIRITGTSISFARNNGPAQIIVDGVPWPQDDLSFIQPNDVAKIETLNGASASILGSQGTNGAIIIYTKEGAVNTEKKVFHTIKQDIEGFYEARVFYAPNPEESKGESNKDAIRNTLYWSPYVHPDPNGHWQENYYNSAVQTNVELTLEGITATGVPVVKHAYYSIEE